VKKTYPGVTVFHEDRPDIPDGVEVWMPGASFNTFCFVHWRITLAASLGTDSEKIGLVVTLGGDGTILHASSLFSVGAVPPVLSFSMGTLGFLLPFRKLHVRLLDS
jgi:NADH kinase